MTFSTLDDVNTTGKRALVRVDFNVPMHEGQVSDDTRLRAAVPTIEKLRSAGAKVILLAHFDRPKGRWVEAMSLAPIAPALAKAWVTPSPLPQTASARTRPWPSPPCSRGRFYS